MPYKFIELKESPFFVELIKRCEFVSMALANLGAVVSSRASASRLGQEDIFEKPAQGKRKGGMKIWIDKLIVNRSPLMGIVLSVILSLSWGLVITLFWGP